MVDSQQAVRALLRVGVTYANEDEESDTTELASLQHLSTHLRQLVSSQSKNSLHRSGLDVTNSRNVEKQVTVRTALGMSTTDIARLTQTLTTLLEDRVATQDLLPLTFDDDANEQAMQENQTAITITRKSMAAAEVYAQLLSMPGALGAGLVKMEAVSALAALLSRWRVECCGREAAMKEANDEDTSSGKRARTAQSSPNTRPRKASRRNEPDTDDSDDESDNDFADLVVEEGPSAFLQPHQLITMGFRVARELSQAPLQKEFMSWSSEARDSIVGTVACVLATSAALLSGRTTSNLADEVVSNASHALQKCLVVTPVDHDDGEEEEDSSTTDSDNLTKRHETTVSILRGLLPPIIMKDVLPKGESGKVAAADAASHVLEGFIQEIADDLVESQKRLYTGRRSSLTPGAASTFAATPKSGRRLRASLGGSARKGTEQVTPPRLKGTKTPRTSSSFKPLSPLASRPRPIISAILGIMQKLATDKSLDKASVRASIADTLQRCLQHLPTQEKSHFLTFLIQLCHSKVSVHRLLAVEVIGRIINEEWIWAEHMDLEPLQQRATPSLSRRKSLTPLITRSSENMPEALFGALQGRLQDRVPTIRTASATALAATLRRLREMTESQTKTASVSGLVDVLAEDGVDLLDSLRRRATDNKATVKRASCEALAELLVVGVSIDGVFIDISDPDVEILTELCRDDSVSVRRAAAEALTRLMECWMSHDSLSNWTGLEKAWSSSVLTMVLDSAGTCASKAVELVERVLLSPLLDTNEHGVRTRAAWRILADLGDGSGSYGGSRTQTEALRSTLAQMASSASVSKDFIKNLLKSINDECISTLDESIGDLLATDTDIRRTGAWCLFDALMGFSKNPTEIARVVKRSKLDVDFVGSSWARMMRLSQAASGETKMNLLRSVKMSLQVLTKLAHCVDSSLTSSLTSSLHKSLLDFSFPAEVISAAISALVATSVVTCDTNQEAKLLCASWIREIYVACEDKISGFVGSAIAEEDLPGLARAIFTVGEVSLVGFVNGDDNSSSGGPTNDKKNASSHTDHVRGLNERPNDNLVDLMQAFAPHFLPGSTHIETPETLRAHAFISLGKLCLRDDKLAKKSLNILARELHENMQNGSWKVQSNALLILGDLCVRYTNMVDRYLPIMAACMQAGVIDMSANLINSIKTSDSALVRKHAILLLSSLLLQDYVKWRGLLFHRFLVAAADEDDEVSNLAEMLLCGPLITKQPRLFVNQFVESLFVLNRCTAHPIYVAAASMGDGGSGISVGFDGINLNGEVGRFRRMQMYQLMLSRMADEDKIGVTARITKEVLGSALESGSDLNFVCVNPPGSLSSTKKDATYESAANVLSDALALLSHPSMRVGRGSKGQTDDDIEDPNVSTTNSSKMLAARGRLLSTISRKHLIEIILPILVRLKAVLQQSCSSLLKDLMSFLVGVFRQYKNEVKEFLANEPSLLQEIEYDAKQFQRTQRQNSTPTANMSLATSWTSTD